MESFGNKLRRLRGDAEISQSELIDLMRAKNPSVTISKSMISKWENDKEEPRRFQDVATLSEVFGVTTDYLIGIGTSCQSKKANHKRIAILGSIAAGLPLLAQEDVLGYEYVQENTRADFCLYVNGDSMIGARILDGDLIYIRQQSDVETGEIAAVLIDGDTATLKRVYKINGTIVLRSENSNYPDQIYSRDNMKEIRILGKAVQFKSNIR